MKVRVSGALVGAFMCAMPLDAQDTGAEFSSEQDTLSKIEKQSRVEHRGRDRARPYHAFYVGEMNGDAPLIAENEDALIHMASLSKLLTAMAYYDCRALAIAAAKTEQERDSVIAKFDAELPSVKEFLVHSDNRQAHRGGLFLEHLDLDFINRGVEEQGLKRGRYRVFSNVIIPEVLKPLGLKDTKIYNPSGLPPYEFGRRYRSGYFIYSRKERPFNYKGSGSGHYKDPTDYNTTTPYEAAKILQRIVTHYPEIHKMLQISELWNTRRKQNKANTNTLLEHSVHKKARPSLGVDAGKTGTSIGAGSMQGFTANRLIYKDSARIFAVDAGHWKWARDRRKRLFKNPDRTNRDKHSHVLIDSAYGLLERKYMPKADLAIKSAGVVPFDHSLSYAFDTAGLRRKIQPQNLYAQGVRKKGSFLSRVFVKKSKRSKQAPNHVGHARRPEEPRLSQD